MPVNLSAAKTFSKKFFGKLYSDKSEILEDVKHDSGSESKYADNSDRLFFRALKKYKDKCLAAQECGFISDNMVHFKGFISQFRLFYSKVFGGKNLRARTIIVSFVFGLPAGIVLHALKLMPWSSFNGFFSFISFGLILSIIFAAICLPLALSAGLGVVSFPYSVGSNTLNRIRYHRLYNVTSYRDEIYSPNCLTKYMLSD